MENRRQRQGTQESAMDRWRKRKNGHSSNGFTDCSNFSEPIPVTSHSVELLIETRNWSHWTFFLQQSFRYAASLQKWVLFPLPNNIQWKLTIFIFFSFSEDDFASDLDLKVACVILQKQMDLIKGQANNILVAKTWQPDSEQQNHQSVKTLGNGTDCHRCRWVEMSP